MARTLLFVISLFFFSIIGYSQSAQWAWTGGGSALQDGGGFSTHIAPNGNVVVAGQFEGTIDLDPSAATYNIISNGLADIFVACYTPSGVFLWGFGAGGSSRDVAFDLALDAQGNVFVTGFFRGTADMDPSANTAFITDNTTQSFSQLTGGDIFLAKYSPTGAFLWTFSMGGWSMFDWAHALAVDEAGCVYLSGVFIDVMDIDPSAAVVNKNSQTGKILLAKYSPNGQLIWGKNFATACGAACNLAIRGLVVKGGNIYQAGYFTFTSDFDPSSNVVSYTSNGLYDGYVAKFDTAGNYTWVVPISGNGYDEAFDLRLDANNNIYITGFTTSTSIDFSPFVPSNVTAPIGSAGNNIMMAKYTDAGVYQWGRIIGSPGDDWGWDLELANNKIYATGQFGGVTDFDPSAGVANLTPAGSSDVYVAQYDLNGNYLCAFNIGGSTSYTEPGHKITSNTAGDIFVTGAYAGTNVDFDPSAGSLLRSSLNNNIDAFLVKYVSAGSSPISASGDSVCPGEQAYLTFYDSSATGSYSVVLNDGNNTYTYTNVQNGVPVPLNPNPIVTTTYTWSVAGGGQLACSSGTTTGTVTVVVRPQPFADAGPDVSACPGTVIQLQGSGGTTFLWSAGVSNPSLSNPTYTAGTSAATLTLIVADSYSCTDTDYVQITMSPQPVAYAGADTAVCPGAAITLHATGGAAYVWYPVVNISGANTANPSVIVNGDITYYAIVTDAGGCSDTDAISLSIVQPSFITPDAQDLCVSDSVVLNASGGSQYQWYPDEYISSTLDNVVTVWPPVSSNYYVIITEPVCGYMDTMQVQVNVHPLPEVKITRADPIGCGQAFGQLEATGALSYRWTPAEMLDSDSVSSPKSYANADTWYQVVGTDQYGCENSDSVRMRILADNLGGLFVPTVFSPNSDGKNDCYRILQPTGITDFELHIYNRFGNNVYNADDAGDCWDGTYKGQLCDAGVYYYYYKFKSPTCGKAIEGKGDITLVR